MQGKVRKTLVFGESIKGGKRGADYLRIYRIEVTGDQSTLCTAGPCIQGTHSLVELVNRSSLFINIHEPPVSSFFVSAIFLDDVFCRYGGGQDRHPLICPFRWLIYTLMTVFTPNTSSHHACLALSAAHFGPCSIRHDRMSDSCDIPFWRQRKPSLPHSLQELDTVFTERRRTDCHIFGCFSI